jgi:hypothetical protein
MQLSHSDSVTCEMKAILLKSIVSGGRVKVHLRNETIRNVFDLTGIFVVSRALISHPLTWESSAR